MIAVIVIGHGEFADGLLSAAELITGKQEGVTAINFAGTESPEALFERILNKYEKLAKRYEHVLIFSDIVGGTPFNQAARLKLLYTNVYVFAGISLPPLLELLMNREQEIEPILENLIDAKLSLVQFDP